MTTTVRLDYQRSMKPMPWAGVAMLGLALLILALAGRHYQVLNNEIAHWEAVGEQAGQSTYRRVSSARLADREMQDTALEVKHANEVLRRLTLPWDRLFQAVEASAGRDVTLLAMEPDMEKRVVKISGEAKNIAALLNYITHLEERDEFGSVYLRSHQIQQQDPERPVRFSLSAAWRAIP